MNFNMRKKFRPYKLVNLATFSNVVSKVQPIRTVKNDVSFFGQNMKIFQEGQLCINFSVCIIKNIGLLQIIFNRADFHKFVTIH